MVSGQTALTRYAASRDLGRGGLGETHDAVLARSVGGRVADADQPGDGGGVDDRAGAHLEHSSQLVLHAQPDPLEVDVYDAVPVDLLKVGCKPVTTDS